MDGVIRSFADFMVDAPTSTGSPLCALCGHRRDEHVDLRTGARGGCRGQDYDFQTLTPHACACDRYVHRFSTN